MKVETVSEPRRCLKCDRPLSGRATKWCSENCRKRACEHSHRKPCPKCGAPMAGGSAWPSRDMEVCRSCDNARRVDEGHERHRLVERLWNEGASQEEIREVLGWRVGSATSVAIYEARAAGYHLPYRYTTGRRAGRKFPEQVAA